MLSRILFVLRFAATVLMCCGSAVRAETPFFKIGVATVEITPQERMMLVGYAARTEPFKGVAQPLFAKAIAFEDATGTRALLLTTDLIGFHQELGNEIAEMAAMELGIARERLMLSSSHTHTGPLLYRSRLSMYDLSEEQVQTLARYVAFLKKALLEVMKMSLENLAQAAVSFGNGEAHLGVNRRVFTPSGVNFGINPDGPVDPCVPVLVASDPNGSCRAVLFGYACHGTTLTKDDYFQVCGDYMGFAQAYLEQSQSGMTSLFVAGCGGDTNPNPRGTLAMARLHGLELAGAVARVLNGERKSVSGPLRCSYRTVALPFAAIPSGDVFRERLGSENRHVVRHARHFLDILERGEAIPTSHPYPIQVWQFGNDLTLVALGGEVVADYAIRLQRELGDADLWTIGYANDVCGYIGSARILYEGGYEADQSTIYYTLPTRWDYMVEEIIVAAVREAVTELRQEAQ